MVELSGVCEQVTQLDVFSRTLQFSQLEGTHRKAIERIVDVLLGLHNRVGYLSRRKPQLIKEFENAEQKLAFINERVEEFLTGLEQETPQIEPLSFTGLSHKWKCQLTENFTSLQSHVTRMSEVIIRQDNFHTHDYRKFECFVGIVELFSKVMSGDEAALEEWN